MAEQYLRKGRLGNRKTTTGCKTCKNRKLKCDEARPNCVRCTKSRRMCLGYTASPPSGQGDPSSNSIVRLQTHTLALSPGSTAEESELSRFFLQHAASGLAGILDAEFWTSILPQLSSSWQSVRYGLLAVSAFTRDRCRLWHGQVANACSAYKRSSVILTGIKFYKKALAATRTELAASNRNDLAILTCILFFCIECLQGRHSEALVLCQRGQTILDQTQNSCLRMTCYYPALMRSMKWMFARVRIVATLRRPPLEPSSSPADRAVMEQEQFDSLCEARWVLLNLTTDVLSLQDRAAEISVYARASLSEMAVVEVARGRLIQALQLWQSRAAGFFVLDDSASRHQHLARRVLQCHALATDVMLECSLSTTELSYDDFNSSFRQIVQNCTEIIAIKSEDDQKEYSYTHFQLETGIMLPLFLTACKCRDMKLRTEAVELMQQGPEQEGLWTRERLIQVARRVIEIEGKSSDDYGRLVHFNMDLDHHITDTGQSIVRISFVQRLKDGSRRMWEESFIH